MKKEGNEMEGYDDYECNYLQEIKEEGFSRQLGDEWAEALRSDEHVQATGRWVARSGKQCCLAVLGEILDLETTSSGMPYNLNKIIGYELTDSFIAMNDKMHMTFDDIADVLESDMSKSQIQQEYFL